MSRQSWLTLGMGGVAVAMVAGSVALSLTGGGDEATASEVEGDDKAAEESSSELKPARAKVAPFKLEECAMPVGSRPVATREKGNPLARASAQKGLDFLTKEALAWQKQHNCYGCHVQAVTVEALAVGYHHQYDVGKKDLATILDGMLTLNGGARTPQGLGHSSPSIATAAKVLGSAAFARYDRWVDAEVHKDLLKTASEILEYQRPDGSIVVEWNSAPVATGTTQSTAQAMIVFKQAYERSADDQWLTAVQRAEDYLHGVISSWSKTPPQDIQEINYAVMGLLAAGVGNTEDIMVKLQRRLLNLQSKDGSWGEKLAEGETLQVDGQMNALRNVNIEAVGRSVTAPFATGQTIYTLRMLGMTDGDEAIARGTKWLIDHQQPTGGWSVAGFGKAEAMWAVLGLVSTDVMTLAVEDLKNGQHVEGKHAFKVDARDNKSGGVLKIEIAVDDIPAFGACASQLSWAWDTSTVDQGKHLITIAATNVRGEVSKRIFEVYTGDVYLTQLGTRFDNNGTVVSLRNIAPSAMANTVEMEILGTDDKGAVQKGAPLRTIKQDGSQGSMSFFWDGKDGGGKDLARGRYVARVTFRDQKGGARQTEDLVFVHDTAETQQNEFGQIQGSLNFADGDVAANSEVELIDEEGNVVQSVWSNGMGNYRFRNVDGDRKYKVRLNKKGFKPSEMPISAPKAAEAKGDMMIEAE